MRRFGRGVFGRRGARLQPARARRKALAPGDRPLPGLPASPRDREGKASVEPRGPFPVGSEHDFRVTATVGPGGIDPGGFIVFQISPWWGWSPPQAREPGAPGFVEVSASFSSPPLRTAVLPLNRVLVCSPGASIPGGGTVTLDYRRVRVDRFAEAAELFQVFVDADGDGHSAPLEPSPAVAISARDPVRLQVHSPSIVVPGKELEVVGCGLDPAGNWGRLPPGSYELTVVQDGREAGRLLRDLVEEAESVRFAWIPAAAGIYFFRISGPGDLEGTGNVTWCRPGSSALNLYFGDIHGHTRVSDGTGTPEDFYRFARIVSGLDIAAVTDHCDYGTIRFPGEPWQRNCAAAREAYRPGSFVTLAGYEWTNWNYGHRNVYFRDGDGPVFTSLDPASDTPPELWELLKPYPAMTVAHHPGGGPVPEDWSIPPPAMEPLVEVCSIHGSSEYYGCEKAIYHPVKGAFVRDALERGYRLGMIGGGDTHDGHPGRRSVGALVTGIMGVWAKDLTRESVWEALQARRVYATSGPKIILNFRAADSPMGSETSWSAASGPLPLSYQVIACAPLARVEIVRAGDVVFREPGEGVTARGLLEDPNPVAGETWYYLKAVQEDGEMAWSSPIWVKLDRGNAPVPSLSP